MNAIRKQVAMGAREKCAAGAIFRQCESDADRFDVLAEAAADQHTWFVEEDERLKVVERRLAEIEKRMELVLEDPSSVGSYMMQGGNHG